ncbi:MAG: GNAT family N-acetyltransferase [Anaerolineae bacterium]
MADLLTIRKVENQRDFKLFFEFPWVLYKTDPHWVPPLLSQRRELLDKAKNPEWQYLVGDYYLAMRGNRPVGTIAAFINKRHNETHQENLGWFGFFECENDQEAANGLLQAAVDFAAANGCIGVRGPASFTLNDECGLLIEGFEQPILLMPYNYPYYQQLIENSPFGFSKVMDTVSYVTDPSGYLDENGNVPADIKRQITTATERFKVSMRRAELADLKNEVMRLADIYRSAWAKNWGFVPPTDAEMEALFANLRQFFDPQLGEFGLVDGQIAGFMLALPDMNQVLKHAYPRPGEPEIITLLKAFWHWKIRPKITRQRILLYGIKAEYRRMGVDAAIILAHIESTKDSRYPIVDMGWVLETNTPVDMIVKRFGGRVWRRYRFFQAPLPNASPA